MPHHAESEEFLSIIQELREQLWSVPKGWFWKTYAYALSWVILVIATGMIGLWPISQMYLRAKIYEYQAVKMTIHHARELHPKLEDTELRGIQADVAKWNGWLAYWQAWNKIPFVDFYIPDQINNLEPME